MLFGVAATPGVRAATAARTEPGAGLAAMGAAVTWGVADCGVSLPADVGAGLFDVRLLSSEMRSLMCSVVNDSLATTRPPSSAGDSGWRCGLSGLPTMAAPRGVLDGEGLELLRSNKPLSRLHG
jgi:hypothetical protein